MTRQIRLDKLEALFLAIGANPSSPNVTAAFGTALGEFRAKWSLQSPIQQLIDKITLTELMQTPRSIGNDDDDETYLVKAARVHSTRSTETPNHDATAFVTTVLVTHANQLSNAEFRKAAIQSCAENHDVAEGVANKSNLFHHFSHNLSEQEFCENITNIAKKNATLAAKIILNKRSYHHPDAFKSIIEACQNSNALAGLLLRSRKTTNRHFFNFCVEHFLKEDNGLLNWIRLYQQENSAELPLENRLSHALIAADTRFYTLHNLIKTIYYDDIKRHNENEAIPFEFSETLIEKNFCDTPAVKKRILQEKPVTQAFAQSLSKNAFQHVSAIYVKDNTNRDISSYLLKRASRTDITNNMQELLEILEGNNSHDCSFRALFSKRFSKQILSESRFLHSSYAWNLDAGAIARLIMVYGNGEAQKSDNSTDSLKAQDDTIIQQLFRTRRRRTHRRWHPFETRAESLIDSLEGNHWLDIIYRDNVTYVNNLLADVSSTTSNTIKHKVQTAARLMADNILKNKNLEANELLGKLNEILSGVYQQNITSCIDIIEAAQTCLDASQIAILRIHYLPIATLVLQLKQADNPVQLAIINQINNRNITEKTLFNALLEKLPGHTLLELLADGVTPFCDEAVSQQVDTKLYSELDAYWRNRAHVNTDIETILDYVFDPDAHFNQKEFLIARLKRILGDDRFDSIQRYLNDRLNPGASVSVLDADHHAAEGSLFAGDINLEETKSMQGGDINLEEASIPGGDVFLSNGKDFRLNVTTHSAHAEQKAATITSNGSLFGGVDIDLDKSGGFAVVSPRKTDVRAKTPPKTTVHFDNLLSPVRLAVTTDHIRIWQEGVETATVEDNSPARHQPQARTPRRHYHGPLFQTKSLQKRLEDDDAQRKSLQNAMGM